jgi:alpha-mannosidase
MQIESPVFDSMTFESNRVVLNYKIARVGDGPAETSTISQVLTFSSEFPFIDFKTVVNWTQHNKLLKVTFPTTVRARFARFGIQFGHIQRPTHKNTRRDMAKFEAAGRWVDLSESSGGLSLCSSVKAGFDVHEKVIRMSLLKAPLQTDKWADFGIRKFSYRLICHQGGFEESHVVQLSDELVVPVVVGNAERTGSLLGTSEFVVVRDEKVVLETLKPAFDCDGFVCRFYESSGGWRRTIVTFPLLENAGWDVEVVDLMERRVDTVGLQKASQKQLEFELTFNAFELKTVLVRRYH